MVKSGRNNRAGTAHFCCEFLVRTAGEGRKKHVFNSKLVQWGRLSGGLNIKSNVLNCVVSLSSFEGLLWSPLLEVYDAVFRSFPTVIGFLEELIHSYCAALSSSVVCVAPSPILA